MTAKNRSSKDSPNTKKDQQLSPTSRFSASTDLQTHEPFAALERSIELDNAAKPGDTYEDPVWGTVHVPSDADALVSQIAHACVLCPEPALAGRKYCAAHQERANGQTLEEKVKEQRNAALAVISNEAAHPDTDEHRAGCTHCQHVHDSKQQDAQSTNAALIILREFVTDVNAVGRKKVGHDWPDLSVTFNKAEALLSAPPAPAQESKTWTPPVTCGQCDATADSVLELAKHWKTSGHTTARVQINSGPRRRKEDQPGSARTYFTKADECVRLCEALAAFWGDGVCDAPIWPGAFLTEEDTPIRDLIRAAVGWRKPLPGESDIERDRR